MRAVLELREESGVEAQPAAGPGVDQRRPALYPFGIELFVPARVKGVGEVDALAVAAHLDHLRAAVERSAFGVLGLANDSAEVDASRLLRLERIAHGELQELAGSPCGDVEPFVAERKVAIGHERRPRF